MSNAGGSPLSSGSAPNLAVIRLAGGSVSEIKKIDASDAATKPFAVTIDCKQVPDVPVGTIALIWLGSDNNKGGATSWKQGFRAIGAITNVKRDGGWKDPTHVSVQIEKVFDESISKAEIVKAAGANYPSLIDFPIVGVHNYKSQVVQIVDPDSPTQNIATFASTLAALGAPSIADDLGSLGIAIQSPTLPSDFNLDEDDPILDEVRLALQLGYAGAILIGPPGTGKSWYAPRIAHALSEGALGAVSLVQFHPSYQYEDFMEGFVPDAGAFTLVDKVFLRICDAAKAQPGTTFVLVIDEISRCDAARVFGEALTYIETDKRNKPFLLASGREMKVPGNLVILATMNPQDRGIDEIDLALERRFAQIEIEPSAEQLRKLLNKKNGIGSAKIDQVLKFFEGVQKVPNTACHIGHTYFIQAESDADFAALWKLQLRHFFKRACRFDQAEFGQIEKMWSDAMSSPEPQITAETPPTQA